MKLVTKPTYSCEPLVIGYGDKRGWLERFVNWGGEPIPEGHMTLPGRMQLSTFLLDYEGADVPTGFYQEEFSSAKKLDLEFPEHGIKLCGVIPLVVTEGTSVVECCADYMEPIPATA